VIGGTRKRRAALFDWGGLVLWVVFAGVVNGVVWSLEPTPFDSLWNQFVLPAVRLMAGIGGGCGLLYGAQLLLWYWRRWCGGRNEPKKSHLN
jgi:hypothetical protein